MSEFIPYGRQCIEADDVQAVLDVLRSDTLTQGPALQAFEEALAARCGAAYAVAFSSGTAALHGAYFAAGVGPGDEIVTSPITFAATANAALFLGARPVFADVDPETGNLDPDAVASAITRRTKAVVPVHFAGHPAELSAIREIAARHGVPLIEDACHALGATYRDSTIGDCAYSSLAAFSFHPVKPITTGEGGAVLTNDAEACERLRVFRHHGITRDPAAFRCAESPAGGWYYEMQHLGNNYRLTDIHAALGVSQLKKLDRFVVRRREIAGAYAAALGDNRHLDVPVERDGVRSAWHLYPIRLRPPHTDRKAAIFQQLRDRGLGVQVHYIPVPMQPYYRDLGYDMASCAAALDFYRREISIPIHPGLSNAQIDRVVATLQDVLEA